MFGKGGASPFFLVPHIEHADFETEFFNRIAAAAEDWDGKTDPAGISGVKGAVAHTVGKAGYSGSKA